MFVRTKETYFEKQNGNRFSLLTDGNLIEDIGAFLLPRLLDQPTYIQLRLYPITSNQQNQIIIEGTQLRIIGWHLGKKTCVQKNLYMYFYSVSNFWHNARFLCSKLVLPTPNWPRSRKLVFQKILYIFTRLNRTWKSPKTRSSMHSIGLDSFPITSCSRRRSRSTS